MGDIQQIIKENNLLKALILMKVGELLRMNEHILYPELWLVE